MTLDRGEATGRLKSSRAHRRSDVGTQRTRGAANRMGPGPHARPRCDPRVAETKENPSWAADRHGAPRGGEDRGPRALAPRGRREGPARIVQPSLDGRQRRLGPSEAYGLEVYAKKWETAEEYYANLHK